MVRAKAIAPMPTASVTARASNRSLFSEPGRERNGRATSFTKATDAALRNESADDITTETMPAITKPFSTGGVTATTTSGSARLAGMSGSIARATRPIRPDTAKKGMENRPDSSVPRAVAAEVRPISKRWM